MPLPLTPFTPLLKRLPPWFGGWSDLGDVIVGTMGRMIRNLRGYPFPGWSTAETRRETASLLLPLLKKTSGLKNAFCCEMSSLSLLERRALLERKLISPCMAARQDGCHIMLNKAQNLSLLINEEEHLVTLAFQDGFEPDKILKTLVNLSHTLDDALPIARDSHLGYLSSIPAESGEGAQFYILLHLPALALADTMPQIVRAVEKMQLTIAPLYAELPDGAGNLFVASTPPTSQGLLIPSVQHLASVASALVEREQQMRAKFIMETPVELLDRIGRAYGLFRYAACLSFHELIDMLSMLRLGIECHLIRSEKENDSSKLHRSILPLYANAATAHLQLKFGEEESDYIPAIRAQFVREALPSLVMETDCFLQHDMHS